MRMPTLHAVRSRLRPWHIGLAVGVVALAAVLVGAIAAGQADVGPRSRADQAQRGVASAGADVDPTSDTAAPDVSGVPGAAPSTTARARTPRSSDHPVVLRTPVRCAPKGTPAAPPLADRDRRDGKEWVTVSRLSGACDASSGPFDLKAIDTRLVWRTGGTSFAVFAIDERTGIDGSAGFADGSCAESCSDVQTLVLPPGRYTLRVQADAAAWEVEMQEYRRP